MCIRDSCVRPLCPSHRAWKSAGRSDLLVGQQQKSIYTRKIFVIFQSPICREASNGRICAKFCTGESSRRRNHLFQILCRSVEGFRICAGSNFAILHWQPVTLFLKSSCKNSVPLLSPLRWTKWTLEEIKGVFSLRALTRVDDLKCIRSSRVR